MKVIGTFLYHLRWAILPIALLITIAASYYGIGVFSTLQGATINDPTSESVHANQLINTKFNTGSADVVVLLSSKTLKATDAAFKHATLRLEQTLEGRKEVSTVTSYYTANNPDWLSRDGHEILMTIKLSTNAGSTKSAYLAIAPLLTSPTLTTYVGGSIVSTTQFNNQTSKDLQHAELITLPMLAILLYLIFGGLIAAALPLLIGAIAITGSFAILHVLSNFMDISSFAVDVVAFMGLGLAIDYSLFIVTRFREELALDEQAVQRALIRTMSSAGRTIFFSGLTVSTSLICLLIFPEMLLRSIGLAAISSALVAMLASLFVLPALLATLGRRVNALSVRKFFHRSSKVVSQQKGFWYALAKTVMRLAIPVSLVLIALVLFLGTPFLHASFSAPDERSLPAGASARVVQEHLKQNFVGQGNARMSIVVTTPGNVLSADTLAELQSYVLRLQAIPSVTNVLSLVSLDPHLNLKQYQQGYAHPAVSPALAKAASQLTNGNMTEIIVTTSVADHSDQAHTLVGKVRAVVVPTGFTRQVGGDNAAEADLFHNLQVTIPRALLIMGIAILLLLFLLTGSVILPIKAVVLNVLSLSATFGVLVWGFQDGHLQHLLGFQSVGSLDSTQTILIFALAFALSMDYEVFLLSRIREQYDLLHDNREAVAIGLQRTGGLITSAAILLAVVIGAFATSRIIFIQEIGVGVALAVLMDATLIRSLLVPAMMSLLGNINWWAPRPLQALWSVIGLRESVDESNVFSDPALPLHAVKVQTASLEETRTSAAIHITHLSKTYRKQKDEVIYAVQDLNLVVPRGQVLGFLGANGAGKTTAIKMICGLITPTQGKIYVGGYDVAHQHSSAMRQIGVVLEGTRNIYWRLTPWQNLMYFGHVKQCGGKTLRRRAKQLLSELDLWDRRHDSIRTFSRGMQQKVAIACALIADPPIILLDEPTLGLDIQAARTVKEWIARLSREQGKTVILTTHQLDIAQELCDRVAIMRKGLLLTNQPLDDLLHVFHQESYQIRVKRSVKGYLKRSESGQSTYQQMSHRNVDHRFTTFRKHFVVLARPSTVHDLSERPFNDPASEQDDKPFLTPEMLGRFSFLSLNIEDNEAVLTGALSGQDELYELLALLRNLALPLASVKRVEPNLEEVFIRLVEEQQQPLALLQGVRA